MPLALNPFKHLRQAARDRNLDAADIERLLSELTAPVDIISRLRFALRLKRWCLHARRDWLLTRNLEREIAAIYRQQHDLAESPATRLRYARWARRYGIDDFDWKTLESDFQASLRTTTDSSLKLAKLCDADLGFEFDIASGTLRAKGLGGEAICTEVYPVLRVASKLLLSRESRADAGLEFGPWSLALQTDAGLKPPNQDAALFAGFSDDSFLAAIADGTGDSHDGARAAEVVLPTIVESLAITGNLGISVELAAAKVRADNLDRREENSCTLVALHVRKNGATLVHLSDPFHWIQLDGATSFWSQVDKSNRANVGGEPFGYTLTSSGNRVKCFASFSDTLDGALQELGAIRSFVLGCDGLLPIADEEVAPERCSVAVNFSSHGERPFRVARNCTEISRQAMNAKRRCPDNITCVAACRQI